jgi:DNA-binding MarR family transcriptional regulator
MLYNMRMKESVYHPQLQAWGLFLRVHSRLNEQLERELLAECQLPLTWYDVLVQLNNVQDARLRHQDLSQSIVLSKSGLSRRIDRMEAEGLVRREVCPFDGRGVYEVLTDKGRAVLAQASAIHLRGIENHFARHMSDDEARVLRSVFRRILESESPDEAQSSDSACPGV